MKRPKPPYGFHRLLLDEAREPVHVLVPGQRKSIQNQRVTLTEGLPEQVAVIRRIFYEFVELGHSEYRIAEGLNGDGIVSLGGLRWGAGFSAPTAKRWSADAVIRELQNRHVRAFRWSKCPTSIVHFMGLP